MRAEQALLGARVERVAAPALGLLAIELSSRELRGTLLIGVGAKLRGIGWLDGRTQPLHSSPWLMQLKSRLLGARIEGLDARGQALRLRFRRGDQGCVLEAVLAGERGGAWLRACDGELLAQLHTSPASCPQPSVDDAAAESRELDLDALRQEGKRLLGSGEQAAIDRRREALARKLRAATNRTRRKLLAIEDDAKRAEQVPRLRRDASLVLCHLHELSRDTTSAVLLDLGIDPPEQVALCFAPELGPKLQAEAWFVRARKLERGAAIAGERAVATRALLAALEILREGAGNAIAAEQLETIERESQALGVAIEAETSRRARAAPKARVPYRQFSGSGARAILVGRGSKDNDRLTLDHARPYDLWLHAREDGGAHVVVPLSRDEDCPTELLVDAATLAAHFSKARGQAVVDVIHTERRYVSKPRKSAPGSVAVQREKVLRLRLESDRLRRLLASEQLAGGSTSRR